MATISPKIDDISRQDASSAPTSSEIPLLETSEFALAVDQLDVSSLAASLTLPEDTPRLLSPVQITSPSTKQKQPFSLSTLLNGAQGGLESLGPDIANAEINIAGDGSFIESSSGNAIRELKRRYDQQAGVGPALRSPYAITGFINQHGKSMYRLTHRDEQAPAASAAEIEDRMTHAKATSDTSHSPRSKRRSRLSMHFLPPTMFKNTMPAHPPSGRAKVPSTAARRSHRKTGSTPDLTGTIIGDVEQSGPTFAVTGRGHSQSVTSVDMVRTSLIFQSSPHRTDAFGELLDLFPPSNASMHSIPVSTDSSRSRKTILQPFGPGLLFSSPNKRGQVDQLRPPRQLREMQSFESTLTARQDDDYILETDESPELDHELSRPPSAIRLSELMSPSEFRHTPEPLELPSSDADDKLSSQLWTQGSTEVFNVIQKYSGLPVFESLVPEVDEGTTVIKLSLSTTPNAAPRDDPRFVIWGELQPDSEYDDYYSSTFGSPTELSASTLSRRRSNKTSRSKQSDATSRLAYSEGGQRILLAATIERWIAQLTSDLNYDELLNFFLTYRTYVSAVDLCHLLIGRFHWTLQNATSRDDEAVHRIVRVRTFVAIRYWLLTFFTVDFIPNRELRLLIADWLNTLLHDPLLKKHMDGIGIIRRLIKVAKDCKKAHIKANDKPKASSPRRPPLNPPEPDHVLGKSFAQAIRKNEDESDLDLDFLPDEATEEASTRFQSDPANAHLTVGHVAGAVVLGQARPTSLPLSSFGILQRPDHSPSSNVDSEPVLQNLQVPLARHSTLSRAFVRTIGRLGRWKRVFQPKSPTLTSKAVPVHNGNVSAFDLELNASVDLLTTERRVEEYLTSPPSSLSRSARLPTVSVASSLTAVAGTSIPLPTTPPATLLTPILNQVQNLPPTPELPSVVASDIPTSPTPVKDTGLALPSPLSPVLNFIPVSDTSYSTALQQLETSDISSVVTPPTEPLLFSGDNVANGTERPESFCSSSTDSFGAPLMADGPLSPTFPGNHAAWQFDVVSIDDLDFSDTSSLPSIHDLPGLRKQRKLPMRRDFEFVRRSEVSSMGIITHESLRDSLNSPTPSEKSPTSSTGAGPQPIQRWQMKSLQQTFEEMSNHSGDKGDVDAALRRLEGQINPKLLQENAEKVDGWLHNLRERMANGDYANSIYSTDEVEEFFDEVDSTIDSQPEALVPVTDEAENPRKLEVIPHALTHSMQQLPTPPSVNMDVQSRVEEVVPVEILKSRMSSVPDPSTALPLASTKLLNGNGSPHRSFILGFSADQLAQHFSMIDRELFMSIKFEELVTGEWLESEEINILDWAQYLKDRARWKAESRNSDKTTALAAVRARFNLMVSFVNAEVALTPPNERPFVVSKFIRIAWHCYQLSNFQSLTAIITGLQNDWVNNAMRKPGWSRLGIFENRIFRDLQQFTSKQDDFRIMRQVVDSIVDSKPLDSSSRTPSIIGSAADSHSGKSKPGSDSRPVGPSTCIPFIGIYLSQLRRLNKLPSVIDPTSPNTLMGDDPITGDLDPPACPGVFASLAPLPSSMQLEPLINVHKQRRVAEVIKSLVAGQHLSSRAQFDVDKKLFQKCLRLRGLDAICLQRALNLYID